MATSSSDPDESLDTATGLSSAGVRAPAAAGLRSQTLRSALWSTTQNVGVRLLSLVTFVVLARLLTPYDYGIAAVAVAFAGFVSILSAAGVSQALVQKPELEDADVDAVFWVSLALGCLLTIGFALAAGPLAQAFRMPELQLVLIALSPIFLAISLGSAQTGLLQRAFAFGKLARISLVANLLATLIGLGMAFAGTGYWALVVQTALVPVISSVGVWRASAYRPRLRLSRTRLLDVVRRSRSFVGINLLIFTDQQADNLVIGRSLGTATLGIYAVAYRTVFIMLEIVSKSLQVVAFPAFARVSHDRQRLRASCLSGSRLATVLAFPGFAFVGVAAPEIVEAVFGEKWLACVPALRVFCAYGALQSLVQFYTAFLQGVGRAGAVLRWGLAGSVLQVLGFLVGVRFGIAYVAAAYAVRGALTAAVLIALSARQLGSGALRQLLWTIAPPLLSSAGLGAVTVLVLSLDWSSPLIAMTVSAVAGVLTYALCLAVVGRRHLAEITSLVRLLRTSKAPGTVPG